jgi:glutamate-1-semialdehyde 2,1-aminomutase
MGFRSAPTEVEIDGETLCRRLPSIELVRLIVGDRSDDVRVAASPRLHGRAKIIKFRGCYHGHGDSLLVKAGPGRHLRAASSAGVPADACAIRSSCRTTGPGRRGRGVCGDADSIATIIVEPIAGNMNLIMPRKGFLEGLRAVRSMARC